MTDDPLRRLLTCLDLENPDGDVFLGDPGPGRGRLFGGLVAAQATLAAARTVAADRHLHSVHAYFLRSGRHGQPLRFEVDRIRDGGSFSTRRVRVEQAGQAVFNLSASFCVAEDGIAHQDPMPAAPPPDGLPDREQLRRQFVGHGDVWSAVEARLCDRHHFDAQVPLEPRQRTWIRVRGTLPDDPRIQSAVLIYLTDRGLMSTATRPHRLPWDKRMAASLDHAVWIHHAVKLEGWLLYVNESPVAHAARGLVLGALYYRDGRRLASVAQEALVRHRRTVEDG